MDHQHIEVKCNCGHCSIGGILNCRHNPRCNKLFKLFPNIEICVDDCSQHRTIFAGNLNTEDLQKFMDLIQKNNI